MKRMIDDGMLDTAAKSFIKHYEGANAPADAPSSENSYFTSIKVAKAKAGARVRINRTIRICAVAAVLMVGLVCALFMGADEVELPPAPDPINLDKTFDAYMWTNNSTDPSENMPVKVRIWMEEATVSRIQNPNNEETMGPHGTVTSRRFVAVITVSDLDGNVVATFEGKKFRKTEAYLRRIEGQTPEVVTYVSDNTELPLAFKHTEMPRVDMRGEQTSYFVTPTYQINMEFNEDFSDFEIFISYDAVMCVDEEDINSYIVDGETLSEKMNLGYVWSHENAIFITCGATTREEAIERRYEIAQAEVEALAERGITWGNLVDRLNNKAWK